MKGDIVKTKHKLKDFSKKLGKANVGKTFHWGVSPQLINLSQSQNKMKQKTKHMVLKSALFCPVRSTKSLYMWASIF